MQNERHVRETDMLRRIRAKGIGIILMMLLCLAMPVQAASPYSLTIDYHYGKASTKIGGATFQVVMVASRDASGNSYSLVDPFTGSDVNPNDVGADVKAQQAAAKSLQAMYKSATDEAKEANPAVTLTTDANGQAVTGVNTPGLYLIWQSGSKGTASQYYNATPMLVYIPTVNDDGMTWQNDITIEPKTSRRPTEDGGGNTDSGDTDNPSDTGGDGNPTDTRKEPAKAQDTAATTKLPTEEMTETEETGTRDPAGENASSAGSTDERWLNGEETGSLKGNTDGRGGWISNGGFSGDNSPMRIYAAIAIFALIVLVAHFLRSKRK